MKHLTTPLLLVLTAAALSGCGDDGPSLDAVGKPQLAEWEAVVKNLPFPLKGDGAIKNITIGRNEFDENFANRGNIDLLFDHDEETITVEIRKYTFSDDIDAKGDAAAGNPGTFDRLSLWAYVSSGNPSKPDSQDPADDCTKDTWKEGCAIYAYYDGKSMPARAGMDFRVHLPKAYRGKISVTTEDNTAEGSYPRRGNIKIDGLCSGGDVSLEAGRATVKMCDDLVPSPTCDAAGIAACEDYVDPNTMEPAPWSKDCGACGDGTLFGQLVITAPVPWAANITVDIPKTVWMNTTLQNTSTMKPHTCKPTIQACVDQQIPCTMNTDDEYAPTAEFNYPGPSAPAGAGFNLTVRSGGCTEIPYIDDPKDWVDENTEPKEELRGLLNVCTGCL